VLLSDVSQTIASALSPQLQTDDTPESPSLLDADDTCNRHLGMVMTPDRSPTSITTPQVIGGGKAPSPPPPQQDDEDEWNW
jgi:hypothetical protein